MNDLQPDPPSDPRHVRLVRLWLLSRAPREDLVAQLTPEYVVETFTAGALVLARSRGEPLPDVLLLDWDLTDSAAILGALRAEPRTAKLSILVLTGPLKGTDLIDALDGGANDYVMTPCSKLELVARVSTLVRASELRRRAETAERENRDLLARERAARAEAEMANFVKDDFLATLSHELRTPLHSILGWVALLRGGTLSPETAERALATIERSGKAQATMIEDLLDISRIVTGKMRLDMSLVDPSDAAEQAIETVRPIAANKRVELVSRLEHVGRVRGDAARLQQIVWNLLTNALRYTPASGRVEVEAARRGEGVLLRVTDTGEGIAPELIGRIFDRFKQGDSTATRAHGGLGIGLAIVRHISELHGGNVRAESAGKGHGACFEVWLPLATSTPLELEREPQPSISSLEGIRVLVVDDEPDALEVVVMALRTAGAAVVAARSAHEALSALDEALPHVIVSDVMMPEIDGPSLLRIVRERPVERGGALPAIALTALASASDRERFLAHGFAWHLAKPIDLGVLSGTVGRLARARGA